MAKTIGALIADLEGTALTPEERDLISHPLIGGIILFARNYSSPKQLAELTESIRGARRDPLLIMVDQEGGRVQRFRQGFTSLPPFGAFGRLYDQDPSMATHYACEGGWLMAKELLAYHVDLSLTPSIDLNHPDSPVIGDRAFHADPHAVTSLANAYLCGMREAGMATTAKHFPGHGLVLTDSHLKLPEDKRSLSELEVQDLKPFRALIAAGLLNAVLVGHLLFSSIDSMPATYSEYWLRDVLRSRLRFSGTIVSDDLSMEGAHLASRYEDRVLAARSAGCDFVLLCNQRQGVINTIDHLPHQAHQITEDKWRPLQGRFSDASLPLQQDKRWMQTNHYFNQLLG